MGRPGAVTIALTKQIINAVVTMIFDDPHLTVRQLVSLLDTSIESMHTLLLTKLDLSWVCSMDSTFTLTAIKNNIHVEACQYLEQVANDTYYLNNVITADETRIYCYNFVFKQQMSEWIPKIFLMC